MAKCCFLRWCSERCLGTGWTPQRTFHSLLRICRSSWRTLSGCSDWSDGRSYPGNCRRDKVLKPCAARPLYRGRCYTDGQPGPSFCKPTSTRFYLDPKFLYIISHLDLFVCLFWNRVLLWGPGWPGNLLLRDLPAFASCAGIKCACKPPAAHLESLQGWDSEEKEVLKSEKANRELDKTMSGLAP